MKEETVYATIAGVLVRVTLLLGSVLYHQLGKENNKPVDKLFIPDMFQMEEEEQ